MSEALPVSSDIAAYRGDTWSQEFRLTRAGAPVDLTGATLTAEARSRSGVTTPITVTVTDALDGRIALSLPTTLGPGLYTYDIEVDQGGTVTTWIQGTLTVARDVSNEL
jgi:FtsP/CotA-like multicopper oxidase with cupredoxin domain